jgi:Domain of unknown function (DUF4340)
LPGRSTVFAMSKAAVEPWRKANELRDTHLVSCGGPVGRIHVNGQDDFTLFNTNGGWVVGVQGENFPADSVLVTDLLSNLTGMEIVQYVKDVVTAPDLPAYGLAAPCAQYDLRFSPTNGSVTNLVVAFGTNQEEKVFVRRTDESAVYAVNASDAKTLATASWQLRDRRIWDFSEEDVAGVEIVQHGQHRELLRQSQYQWSLAPGSTGSIEPLAVEETVRPLCHLNAAFWVACGETNRAQFGLTNGNYQITLKTKKGETFPLEFGTTAPSTFPYAGVKLDGQLRIFELPLRLSRDVVMYLSIARP